MATNSLSHSTKEIHFHTPQRNNLHRKRLADHLPTTYRPPTNHQRSFRAMVDFMYMKISLFISGVSCDHKMLYKLEYTVLLQNFVLGMNPWETARIVPVCSLDFKFCSNSILNRSYSFLTCNRASWSSLTSPLYFFCVEWVSD